MIVYAVLTEFGLLHRSLSSGLFDDKYPEGINLLLNYTVKKHREDYEQIFEISNRIIIDSGAFSLQQLEDSEAGDALDYDKIVQGYQDYITKLENEDYKDKVDGYFEMDIHNLVGYDKVKNEYRETLKEATDKIIPVWHPSLGIDEYKLLCSEYNLIGLPLVGDLKKKLGLVSALVDYATSKGTRVHGLGCTYGKLFEHCPFYSVDSTDWIYPLIYNKYRMNPHRLWDDPSTPLQNEKEQKEIRLESSYLRKKRLNLMILLVNKELAKQKFYKNR